MYKKYINLSEVYTQLIDEAKGESKLIPIQDAVKVENNVGAPNVYPNGYGNIYNYYVLYYTFYKGGPRSFNNGSEGGSINDFVRDRFSTRLRGISLVVKNNAYVDDKGKVKDIGRPRFLLKVDSVLEKYVVTLKYFYLNSDGTYDINDPIVVLVYIDEVAAQNEYAILTGIPRGSENAMNKEFEIWYQNKLGLYLNKAGKSSPNTWQEFVDRAVDIFKDVRAALSTYQQGTSATGGEWDMAGLEENNTDNIYGNSFITALINKHTTFKTHEEKQDFYKWLELKTAKYNQGAVVKKWNKEYSVEEWLEIIIHETQMEIYYDLSHPEYDEDELSAAREQAWEEAYDQAIKNLEDKYRKWKAIQDIYDKGTSATGGDWDMSELEENNTEDSEYDFDVLPYMKLYYSNLEQFVDWLWDYLAREGAFDPDENEAGENEAGDKLNQIRLFYDIRFQNFDYRDHSQYRNMTEEEANEYYEEREFYNLDKLYKKFKDWSAAQAIYNKGTQSTNGEWDMTGLEEKKHPVSEEYKNTIKFLRDALTKDPQRFDFIPPNVNITLKDIEEYYNWIDTVKRKSVLQYFRNSPHHSKLLEKPGAWVVIFVATAISPPQYSQINWAQLWYKEFLDWRAAQAIYNKGTQATNGEWDMTGLEEAPNKAKKGDFHYDVPLMRIKRAVPDISEEEAIKFCEWIDTVKREQIIQIYPGQTNKYKEETVLGLMIHIAHSVQPVEIGSLIKKWYNEFDEWYKDRKAAEQTYNKGTTSTGGEWDISGLEEESDSNDIDWDIENNLSDTTRKIPHHKEFLKWFNDKISNWDIDEWWFHAKQMYGDKEAKEMIQQAYKKFLEYKKDKDKAVDTYNKGTQTTDREWDISGLEENNKYSLPYSSDVNPAKAIDIARQQLGACADAFWKWIFNSLAIKYKFYFVFEPDKSFEENVHELFRMMVMVGVQRSSYSKKEAIKQAHIWFNEYISNFKKTEVYKDCLKTQDIYNKGTQATNGDWDMSGLEEVRKPIPTSIPKGAHKTFYQCVNWLNMRDEESIHGFINYLITIFKPEFIENLSPLVADMIEDGDLDNLFYFLNNILTVNSVSGLALKNKDLLKYLYSKYLDWKNAQDTYNKGTQSTNGEWDIAGL